MLQNPSIELAFIDSGVANADALLAALPANTQVVRLDNALNPWQQMTDALANYTGLTVIHLISHGENGQLQLGGINYDAKALANQAELLNTWKNHLAPGADFLLYGCNVAQDASGRAFINQLSQLTGADVAASTDTTGTNGNWTLEAATGSIEANTLPLANADWQGNLSVGSIFNAQGKVLNFDNPVMEIGNRGENNSVMRYSSVTTINGQAIDAVMTTVLNNTTLDPAGYDSSTGGLIASNFEIVGNGLSVTSGTSGSITLTVQFYKAGTTIPVILQNTAISSLDIDLSQYQIFKGFDRYKIYSDNSILTPTVASDGSVKFQSTSAGTNMPDPISRVEVFYDSVSSIQFEIGITNSVIDNNAVFSLPFRQSYFVGSTSTITTPAPYISYSNTTFYENQPANDGTIATVATLNLLNAGGAEFVDNGSGGIQGATITGPIPAGLTASLVKTGSTTATLTFAGTATNHTSATDITGITVSFTDTSFTNGLPASTVTNAVRNDLGVAFDVVPVTVSVNSVTVSEASPYAVVEVSLSAPSSSDISFYPDINSGTALTGVDTGTGYLLQYLNGSNVWTDVAGTVTIAAGNTSVLLRAAITNDTLFENSENFTVSTGAIVGPVINPNGVSGTVTIKDDGSTTNVFLADNITATPTAGTADDDQPTVSISPVTVNEGSPYAVVPVTLSNASNTDISFTPGLIDGTAITGTDTGTALQYYNGSTWADVGGAVTIAAGSTSVLLRVAVTNDTDYEGAQDFTISTGPITGAVKNAGPATGTVTIKDDGTGTIFNANGTVNSSATPDNDAPTIVYSETVFYEASSNNGTIQNKLNLSLINAGTAKFVDNGSGEVLGATVSGPIPAGLTPHITKTSDTTALIQFFNPATSHANANDVTGITVTFTDASFTNGLLAATVVNATRNDLSVDFDTPLVTMDISSVTVSESSDYAVVQVSLSAPSSAAISFKPNIINGGATSGADMGTTLEYYDGSAWLNAASGVTIAPGETSVFLRTAIINDNILEGSEQFLIRADNRTGPVNVNSTGTVTITDNGSTSSVFMGDSTTPTGTAADNDIPTVRVSSVTVSEASGYAVVEFSLDKPSPSYISFSPSWASGTATLGTDTGGWSFNVGNGWEPMGTTITFFPNTTTSRFISTGIINDSAFEGPESFTVSTGAITGTVSNPEGASGTVTIKDDGSSDQVFEYPSTTPTAGMADSDIPTVTVNSGTVNESGYANIIIGLDKATAFPISFTPTLNSGTAIIGTDTGAVLEYFDNDTSSWLSAASGVTIASPQNQVSLRVTITNDTLYEGSEDFTISTGPITGTVTNPGGATGTIIIADNDPVPTLYANPGNITISEASDYAVMYFGLHNFGGIPASTATPTSFIPSVTSGMATIGTDTGSEIQYYNGSGWVSAASGVTIGAGETGIYLRVAIINDSTKENGEDFTFNTGLITGTVSNPNGSTGTVYIRDDGLSNQVFMGDSTTATNGVADVDANTFINIDSIPLNEASPYAVLRVSFTGDPRNAPVSFTPTLQSGTATIGADTGLALEYYNGSTWVSASSGVTVQPSDTAVYLRTSIVNDTTYEGSENFTISTGPVSGPIGNPEGVSGTVTIKDDGTEGLMFVGNSYNITFGQPDNDKPLLSINSVTVSEASEYAILQVSLNKTSPVPASFQITGVSGNATQGIDTGSVIDYYNGSQWLSAASGVTIPAGQTSALLRVAIVNDSVYEGTEVLQVGIQATGGANPPMVLFGNITIKDDGTSSNVFLSDNHTATPTTGVADLDLAGITSISVSESSPYAVVTVTLSRATSSPVTFTPSIVGGTATVPTDGGSTIEYFNGTSWLSAASGVVIPAGTNTVLLRTPIAQDSVYEGPETFQISTGPFTGATVNIDPVIGTVTIKDDGTSSFVFSGSNNSSIPTTNTPADNDIPVLSVSSVTVSEASEYAVVQVSLSNPSASAISFTPGLTNGTATVGTDTGPGLEYFNGTAWTTVSGPVTIAAGSTSVLLRTGITQNSIYEGPESFTISTGSITGTVTNASGASGTVTIKDDGSSTQVFMGNSTTATTGTADNDVSISYSSTAFYEAAANDGSIFTVATINLLNAGAATFADNGSGGIAGVTFGSVPAGLTANLVKTGPTTATLQFIGNALAHDNANDVSGITIAFSNTSFTGGLSATGLTGAVRNDLSFDFNAPLANLSASSVTISEASEYAIISFSLDQAASADISFIPTLSNGTATVGTDTGSVLQYYNGNAWVSAADRAVISAGNTQVLVRVAIINDSFYEMSEDFTISSGIVSGPIANPVGVAGTVTIRDGQSSNSVFTASSTSATPTMGTADNDRAVLSVSQVTVSESSPYAIAQYSLTHAISTPINLMPVLANGSATIGTDTGTVLEYYNGTAWVNASSGATLPAGATSVLMRVAITQDTVYESQELFFINNSGPINITDEFMAYQTSALVYIVDNGSSTNVFAVDQTTATPAVGTADNDRPTLSVGSVTVSEASEYAVVKVSLSNASKSAISFNPTLVSGTATIGNDSGTALEYFNGSAWVSAATGVTIAPSALEVLLRTQIKQDSLPEGSEYFQISTNPINGGAINTGGAAGTITIKDDGSSTNVFLAGTNSSTPVVGVADNDGTSISSVTVSEASPYAVVTVTLLAPASTNLSFTPSVVSGTATTGTDSGTTVEYYNGLAWVSAAGGAIIPAGSSQLLLRAAIIQDSLAEGSETFQIVTGPITGTGVSFDSLSGTVTIKDDGSSSNVFAANNNTATPTTNTAADNDNPTLTVGSITVSEASDYAVVQVGLSNPSTTAISFTPTLASGTATVGTDTGSGLQYFNGTAWNNVSGPVTIAAGNTSVLLRTGINQDLNYEGPQDFSIAIGGITGAVTNTGSVSGTVTIKDDGSSNQVFMGDSTTATTGPADNDVSIHYNNTVFYELLAVNDGSIANTLTLNLLSAGSATFASDGSSGIAGVTFTGIPDGLVPNLVKTGSTTASLQLTGTATNHTNAYDLSGITVSFSDTSFTGGLTAANVGDAVRNDLAIDFDATLVTLSTAPVTVSEASDYAIVSFSLNQTSSADISFIPTLSNGTATTGTDTGTALQYYNGSTWVSTVEGAIISAGNTEVLVRVAITNDSVFEGLETFTISSGVVSGPVGNSSGVSSTVTIADDGSSNQMFLGNTTTATTGTPDNDTPTVSVSSVTVSEASDYAVVEVSLDNTSTSAISFMPVLTDGTALIGTDTGSTLEYYNGSSWATVSGPVSIAAGSSSVLLRVGIVNDPVYEGSQDFTIGTGAITGTVTNAGGASGVISIKDDGSSTQVFLENSTTVSTGSADNDKPTISVGSVTVSEASPYAVVKVSLSNASASDIHFTPALLGGTASIGTDTGTALQYFNGSAWVSATGGVTIAAGIQEVLLRTQITQDTSSEGSENLQISTGAVTGGVVNTSGAAGTVTIKDDGSSSNVFLADTNSSTPVAGTADNDAVSISSITVSEASPYAVLEVRLAEPNLTSLSFTPSVISGTATTDADSGTAIQYYNGSAWVSAAGGVTIASGSTAVLLRTTVAQDNTGEGSETFQIVTGPITGTNVSFNSLSGTVTIKDDGSSSNVFAANNNTATPTTNTAADNDTPTLTVGSVTISEASDYAVVQVGLSNPSSTAISFTPTLTSGTATVGTDTGSGLQYFNGSTWNNVSGPVTIAAGDTSVLLRTPINQDLNYEGSQDFSIGVSGITGTVTNTGSVSGTVTIKDDGSSNQVFMGDSTTATTGPAESDVSIHYSNTVFYETQPANDGSIITTATLSLLSAGSATFADNGTGGIAGVTFGSVPAGLTAALVKTGPTTATLQFTGTASAHASANNTSDVTVNFSDASFNGVIAANVGDAVRNDLAVKFLDSNLSSIIVNEASPYAVFDFTDLPFNGADFSMYLEDYTATGGQDYGAGVNGQGFAYYSVDYGSTWIAYTGNAVTPNLIASAPGSMMVRIPVINDNIFDNDEIFTLNIVSGSNVTTTTVTIKDDGTGTIYNADGTPDSAAIPDNDTPTVSVSSITISEASPYAVVAVSLDKTSTSAISFTPVLTDGTALIGTDTGATLQYYNGTAWANVSGSVTIAAGSSSVLLRVGIVNDSVNEGAENITISTGPISGIVTNTGGDSGTVTIKDDGSSTNVFLDGNHTATPTTGVADDDGISISSVTVSENSAYAVLTVSLNSPAPTNLTFTPSVINGTATAPADMGTAIEYFNGTAWVSAASGAVIAAGNTSVLLRTAIGQDAVAEGSETFKINTGTITGTNVSMGAVEGTITIKDDGSSSNVFTGSNNTATPATTTAPDNDTPTVTVGSVTVSETSDYAVVQVNLSNPSTSAISFTPSLTGGTATLGTDTGSALEYFNGTNWAAVSGAVTIAASATSVLLRVAITPDTTFEGTESLTLNTGAITGPVLNTSGATGTITIKDDGSSNQVFMGNSTTATTGTADNDKPTLSVSSVTVSEASDYAVVKASLSNLSTSAVRFTPTLVSGTATIGTDTGTAVQYYNGSAWVSAATGVTIAAGTLDVLLRAQIKQDSLPEMSEKFQISTGAITGSVANASGAAGTVTIKDDGTSTNVFLTDTNTDTPVVGTADNDVIRVSSVTVSEASPYAVVEVSLVGPVPSNLSFTPSVVGGSATIGTDSGTAVEYYNGTAWVSAAGGVTIPAGSTNVFLRTAIIQDNIAEVSESFQIATGPITGTNVSFNSLAGTVTIKDDGSSSNVFLATNKTATPTVGTADNDTITVNVSSVTVNESSQYAVVQVNLSNPSNSAITFTPSLISGTATTGTDTGANLDYYNGTAWVAASGGVTIPAGSTSVLVRATIVQDANPEGSETFQISTGTITGAGVTPTSVAGTVTIVDDDPNAIAYLDTASITSVAVSEASDYAVLKLTLSAPGTTALSFTPSIINGTAIVPDDMAATLQYYDGSNWVSAASGVPIAIGTTEVLLRADINQDNIAEGAEAFKISTGPITGTGVSISSVAGTVTIHDDGTETNTFSSTATTNIPVPGTADNDTAVATIADVTVSESSPYAIVQVSLSHPSKSAVTFTPSLIGGTATVTAGSDADTGAALEYYNGTAWVSATSGVTIPAGLSSVLLRVAVNQDNPYEGLETFQITTGTITGTAVTATAATGTVTIADNGSSTNVFLADNHSGTPTVGTADNDKPTISVSSITVSEASDFAVVQVNLTHPSKSAISFTPMMLGAPATAGIATIGTDTGSDLQYYNGTSWSNVSGPVTIAANDTSLLLRVAIAHDTDAEFSENFQITTGNITGTVTNPTGASGTVTIKDNGSNSNVFLPNNDTATPTTGTADNDVVTISSVTLSEASPYAVVEVNLPDPATTNLSFTPSLINGTATAPADMGATLQYFNGTAWVSAATGVTIAAGNSSVLLRTTIVNDNIAEGSETFQISTGPITGTNVNIGSVTGTVMLKDDASSTNVFLNGNNTATPTVGTAEDDRATITTSPVTLSEASPYAVVKFSVDQVRSSAITFNPLLVGGTATIGTDTGTTLEYFNGTAWVSAAASAVIPANATSVLVRAAIMQDILPEGAETFQISTGTITDPKVKGSPVAAIVTIVDDASSTNVFLADNTTGNPTVGKADDDSLTLSSVAVSEASPYAVVELKLSTPNAHDLSFNPVIVNGTAVAPTDMGTGLEYLNGSKQWVTVSSSVTLAAGATSMLLRATINQDAIAEVSEAFTISTGTINVAGGGTLGPVSGTVTIWDDGSVPNVFLVDNKSAIPTAGTADNDTITVTASSVTVSEASPYAVIQVNLSNASKAPVTFTPSLVSDSALVAIDTGTLIEYWTGSAWQSAAAGASIPAGTTSVLLRTAIIQDNLAEGSETFQISTGPISGVGVTTSAVAGTVTIKDDGSSSQVFTANATTVSSGTADNDTPTMSINSVTVSEGSPYAVVQVSLTHPSSSAISFTPSLVGTGSAILGTDTGNNLEYYNGTAWMAADSGVTIPAGQTSVLLRTSITPDTSPEGPETFEIRTGTITAGTVLNSGGVNGTVTIKDDGNSGDVFLPGNTTGQPTPGIADNDFVSVSSVTVSESSPYAVVAVTASVARELTLSPTLVSGTATIGTDTGTVLEYLNGSTWTPINGSIFWGSDSSLLLRVSITPDNVAEFTEHFQISTGNLSAFGLNWGPAFGTVTIDDAGNSQNIFNPENTTPTPETGNADSDTPTVSVNSVTVSEASDYAVLKFSLNNPSVSEISFTPSVSSITATTGLDTGTALEYYNGTAWVSAASGVSFAPGSTEVLVRTTIVQDTLPEISETFHIRTGPITGTVTNTGSVDGQVTITDDGTNSNVFLGNNNTANPTTGLADNDFISISSVTVSEASPYAIVQVTLANPQMASLSFTPVLMPGSATLGADTGTVIQYYNGSAWVSASGGVTVLAGATSVLLRTAIAQDNLSEVSENFQISTGNISGGDLPLGAVSGTITIKDDGSSSNVFLADNNTGVPTVGTADNDTVSLSVSSIAVSEASSYAVVKVGLSNPSTGAISFMPSLVNGTATVGSDTATALEYYNGSAWVSAAAGVTVAAGSTSVLLRTTVINDKNFEGQETLTVQLGNITGNGVNTTSVSGTITIVDDGTNSNVFLADTHTDTPLTGTADNDKDGVDTDGIPDSVETALAQLAGGTNDLNKDGIPDAEQSAVATLAWINSTNFTNAINGNISTIPTNSIVNLSVVDNQGVVNNTAQLENIQVISSASTPAPIPSTLDSHWDPVSYAISPVNSGIPLTDADPARSGLQQKVLIDISAAGLDAGAFNRYMIYVSADTINKYVAAGKPLVSLDGANLTSPAQAGWYDFTARTTGGDGARYITHHGKITGIEISFTDGAFGDGDVTAGQLAAYGVPGHVEPQTLLSQTSATLPAGIDNLILDNVTKSAVRHDATCLPDWMAKMVGLSTLSAKNIANLNGVGNSWDNEITGNNGHNKLSGLEGNDILRGLKGNDTLTGGSGADTLYGGAGKDTFKYLQIGDSLPSANGMDWIADFQRGQDKIDLRSIDANVNQRGNQAFKLVNAFTDKAGQLHYDANTDLLQGDVNGDGKPDFAIEITGIVKLTAADILL